MYPLSQKSKIFDSSPIGRAKGAPAPQQLPVKLEFEVAEPNRVVVQRKMPAIQSRGVRGRCPLLCHTLCAAGQFDNRLSQHLYGSQCLLAGISGSTHLHQQCAGAEVLIEPLSP